MNLSSQGIEILVLTYTANEQTEYLQRNLQRLPPTSDRSLARALRNNFPVKPFNPALIRTTYCNQTGCECIVCTSNPSLMMGLSCPEIGLYTCNVCAWKALQSVAMVTGYEVPGRNCCSNSAWKAVRLWRCL